MTNKIIRTYNYLINEIPDPRVKVWTFMTSPVPLICIITIYLFGVYKVFPQFMKNRKAYDLKKIIFYYNIFQILACITIMYALISSDWQIHYFSSCLPIDYSQNPIIIRKLHVVYYTFYLKIIELIETIFFILRKKNNQVSKLHIYHHVSTLTISWIATRYLGGGGLATFPIIINCFVHILMYNYYLLTSLGPQWQRKLAKWKPKLTLIQMIQFCILIGHATQAFQPDCQMPKNILFIYIPNIIVLFLMFSDFYRKSYKKIIK